MVTRVRKGFFWSPLNKDMDTNNNQQILNSLAEFECNIAHDVHSIRARYCSSQAVEFLLNNGLEILPFALQFLKGKTTLTKSTSIPEGVVSEVKSGWVLLVSDIALKAKWPHPTLSSTFEEWVIWLDEISTQVEIHKVQ